MNRAQKWLMIVPLLASAVVMADEGHGRGGWGGRQDAADHAASSEADRSGRANRADPRIENRSDARNDNRGDNRNNAPPRIWAGAPRWSGVPQRDAADNARRDNDRGHQNDWNRGNGRDDGRSDWRRDEHRDYGRDNDRGRYTYNRYPDHRYSYYQDYGRGYGRPVSAGHRWRRGESLPYAYYDRSRWERDYWRYDLYDPRDGCGWVRSDSDALLVVLATGLVLDAVYDIYR